MQSLTILLMAFASTALAAENHFCCKIITDKSGYSNLPMDAAATKKCCAGGKYTGVTCQVKGQVSTFSSCCQSSKTSLCNGCTDGSC